MTEERWVTLWHYSLRVARQLGARGASGPLREDRQVFECADIASSLLVWLADREQRGQPTGERIVPLRAIDVLRRWTGCSGRHPTPPPVLSLSDPGALAALREQALAVHGDLARG